MREPRPDWSPLGVNFKILDEHPHLFDIRVPPPPPRADLLTLFYASTREIPILLYTSSLIQVPLRAEYPCIVQNHPG